MKTTILVLLAALAVAFFAGCTTATATRSDAGLIQSVLDKLLPPDFTGPAELSHVNQYFTLSIKAGNLRRIEGKGWTWDWLEYERNSHFPVFSGLTWSSTGKVRLGSVPSAPK